jgi:sugar phosphate isomerase/epimerase
MSQPNITFSVFTKPWKMPLPEVGQLVSELGFNGVELPVRPGFQVEPEQVSRDLPRAAQQLAEFGLKITSVATTPNEATIATCAELGIPIIRVLAPIGADGYMATETSLQQEYDALLPLLQTHNVKLGVQNHYGRYVCNAMGLRHLIERYDPRYIGAVWDAAHNGLHGEEPEMALDIVWSHLCIVNLKNAFWRRTTGPEAEDVQWSPYWTTGRQGLASWPRVASALRQRNYSGVVCLTAEYSDEPAVNRLITEDIAFAQSLFA